MRGYALISSLLMLAILFILCLAFLSKQSARYSAADRALRASQARATAWAGMEDARVKLLKDYRFPPTGPQQKVFSYVEPLYDVDNSLAGQYRVTIDQEWRYAPFYVLRVQSEGWLGPTERPLGRSVVNATFDLYANDRSTPALSNPRLFQWIDWQEESSF